VVTDFVQVVFVFTDAISSFGEIGPFFESLAEACGSAVPVFRLIEEVNYSSVNSYITNLFISFREKNQI
jgi:hypothetical protein